MEPRIVVTDNDDADIVVGALIHYLHGIFGRMVITGEVDAPTIETTTRATELLAVIVNDVGEKQIREFFFRDQSEGKSPETPESPEEK